MHPRTDSDNLVALDARVARAVQALVAVHGESKILTEEPLAPRTTFGIGGPAAGLCRVRTRKRPSSS